MAEPASYTEGIVSAVDQRTGRDYVAERPDLYKSPKSNVATGDAADAYLKSLFGPKGFTADSVTGGAAAPAPADTDPIMEARKRIEKQIADAEERSKRIETRGADATRIAGQPTPQPGLPQFRNIPDAPQTKLRSAFEAFKSPAIFLALAGSLASRRPLVGAMQAATGVMEGFQQGDKAKVERERQIWSDQTEAAIKQNKIELDQYNSVMGNANLTMADRLAKVNALFAANKDDVAAGHVRSGAIDQLTKLELDRARSTDKLEQAWLKANAKEQTGIAARDSVVNQIDRAIELAGNKNNLGVRGKVKGIGENLGMLSSTERNQLENLIRTIQTEIHKVLPASVRGKLAKDERDKLDTMIPSLGLLQGNPKVVIENLKQINKILKGESLTRAIGADAGVPGGGQPQGDVVIQNGWRYKRDGTPIGPAQ